MTTRLSAAREFRAIAKQLSLVARAADVPAQPEKTAAAAGARPMPPRRTGVDPRNVLMAVK
jgi:hypothetical protein